MQNRKRKLFIADPRLRSTDGRRAEYNHSIAKAALAAGLDPILLGHRDLRARVVEGVPIFPAFTQNVREKVPHPTPPLHLLALLLGNLGFLVNLLGGLRRGRVAKDSIVFLHTVTAHQFFGCALYSGLFQRKKSPLVLLLQYDPNHYKGPINAVAHRILEWTSKRKNIQIAADSSRLADQIGRLTSAPVHALPYPQSETFSTAWGPRPPSRKEVHFVSLGDARDERGFLAILKAIERIHQSGLAADMKFTLQARGSSESIHAAIPGFARKNLPNVTLLTEVQTETDSRNLLLSADVVLLPYWRSNYLFRVSRIFLDSVAAGKPVIATRDTWMSDELKQYGAGTLCEDQDVGSLVECIVTTKREIARLSELAANSAPRCLAQNSGSAVVQHLLTNKAARVPQWPPKNALVIYPWDDVLKNTSGASVRVSLMLEYFSERFERIRVIQSGGAPDFESGNIFVESFVPSYRIWRYFKKAFTLAVILISRGKSRTEANFLWSYIQSMFDGKFHRRVLNAARGCDIIFLEYTFGASTVAKIAKRLGIPLIITNHDVTSDTIRGSRFLRRLAFQFEVRGLKLAGHAVSMSVEDQRRFLSVGAKTTVIPTPTDCRRIESLPSREQSLITVQRQLGIDPSSRPICLFVGAKHPPNTIAVAHFLEISRQFPPTFERPPFFISAGGCSPPRRAEQFLCAGKVDDLTLKCLYSLADFIVIPLTVGTGVSVKTVEAMAYSKVVIGTSVAFRGSSAIDGVHAVICDDLSEYPHLIMSLIQEPQRAKELARNARAFAESMDFRRIFSEYDRIIGSMGDSGGTIARLPDITRTVDSTSGNFA